jgi:type 1 fimbriae regulatory protein FimB/type 1 fimbriae regulatory protein FimE
LAVAVLGPPQVRAAPIAGGASALEQPAKLVDELERGTGDAPYVFVSERKAPLTDSAFRKIVARAGVAAELGMPVHPHMLRHSTGFKLANDGQDTRAIQHYLGHKNIQHTVGYTQLSAQRFNGFWQD